MSVCWQHVTADLVCQSPLLGAQVTFMDCCCLYGEGWGMECALCPATDSGKQEAPHPNHQQPVGLGSIGILSEPDVKIDFDNVTVVERVVKLFVFRFLFSSWKLGPKLSTMRTRT